MSLREVKAIAVTVLLSGLLTWLHLLRKRHAMERSQYHTGHCDYLKARTQKAPFVRTGPLT